MKVKKIRKSHSYIIFHTNVFSYWVSPITGIFIFNLVTFIVDLIIVFYDKIMQLCYKDTTWGMDPGWSLQSSIRREP